MSEQFVFKATKREKVGKGASRLSRREGLVPATIYGDNKEPLSVCLEPKQIMSQIVKSTLYSNIYKVEVDGKSQEILVRNIQLHPVKDIPIHVDLLRVGAKTITRLDIPVVFKNHAKSAGLKLGGLLNIINHSLEVACNPKNAPKQIEIDLADTRVGTVIKIEDIKLPAGVKTYYPKGYPIASITAGAEEETTKKEGQK
jgi:large subunit ribosomal protein L25